MVFEPSSSAADLADAVRSAMDEAGLVTDVGFAEERHVLRLTASAAVMESFAERDEMLKLTANPDHITGEPRMEPFLLARADEFAGRGTADFFFPCERARIVEAIMRGVGAARGGKAAKTAARLAASLVPGVDAPGSAEEGLVAALARAGLVEAVCPLHDPEASAALWSQSLAPWPPGLPVDELQRYYGSETAFYFAWLDHLTAWLAAPSVVGLALFLLRPRDETADTDTDNAVFSLFVVVWGFLYLASWARRGNELACRWDTLSQEHADEPNPGFVGAVRVSRVTGEPERHYPSWRRWALHYPLSAAVTAAMLVLAFGVMALSLNLQGYVHTGSPIYVPALAHVAAPGGIFDQALLLPSLAPVVLHTLVILALNKAYSHVAEWLTAAENHKWEHDREASLVYKRFLFEAFDCYVALFYIAFYELDIVKLRGELVSLYTVDSLRRVAVECVVPIVLQAIERARRAGAAARAKRDDDVDPDVAAVVVEAARDEYESFDDYLEMVIQLGYVMLFASAFPLAAPLSLLCNIIEARSDAFKLTFVCRRPSAKRARGIGPWMGIATAIVWMSVVTNVVVMGLTTEQLMTAFPSLFQDLGATHSATKGAVELMVGIEHGLLLVGLAVTLGIRKLPAWVRDDMKRREHERKRALFSERARLPPAKSE